MYLCIGHVEHACVYLVMSPKSTSETFEVLQHGPISHKKVYILKSWKSMLPYPRKKLKFLYQSHCCITEGGTRTFSLEGHRLTKSCTYDHMVQLSRHLPTVKMTTPYASCTKVRNGIDKNSVDFDVWVLLTAS
jgi:hypothetical protein